MCNACRIAHDNYVSQDIKYRKVYLEQIAPHLEDYENFRGEPSNKREKAFQVYSEAFNRIYGAYLESRRPSFDAYMRAGVNCKDLKSSQ